MHPCAQRPQYFDPKEHKRHRERNWYAQMSHQKKERREIESIVKYQTNKETRVFAKKKTETRGIGSVVKPIKKRKCI
jgi:hypothetical protein